jgi:hypothetical protein
MAWPEAGETFGLAPPLREAPRLGIDLTIADVMEPDPMIYRLTKIPMDPARFYLKAPTGQIWWIG